MRLVVTTTLAVGLLVTAALLVAPADVVERVWWSTVWPWWSIVAGAVQRSTRWSATLTVLPITLVVGLAWAAWRPPRRRRAAGVVATWVAVLVVSFVPAWGASYRRDGLAARLPPTAQATADAHVAALQRLVDDVVAAAAALDAAARAAPSTGDVLAGADDAAAVCVADLDAHLSGRRLELDRVVRSLPAGTLLRGGYAGIALPWLLEAHVDAGLPPAAQLATAVHELVHTAGWGREADVDAIAVLASAACDDHRVRYAGTLHGVALVHASLLALAPATGVVSAADAELARLPARAVDDRRDLRDAVTRWRSPAVAEAVGALYDGYLRTQGVETGIADYGRAGGLVASAFAACGEPPAGGAAALSPAHPWCR